MTLHGQVRVHLDRFSLTVDLAVEAGTTVAVVGPNGAGKSTLLRTVAGLQALDAGRLELTGCSALSAVHGDGASGRAGGGVVLDDPAVGIWVAPEHRRVGVVFQEHLLFPHLDALDNIAFGLRCAGRSRASSRASAAGWLERVGLADRASARPADLSGGEAQRVALARALAAEPAVLLLDEPLAALDVTTRAAMRHELRGHLADFPGVRLLVTHDPVDVAALADRVIVLEHGGVVQEATPYEIATRPRTSWVAALAGVNLLTGAAAGTHVVLDAGGALTLAEPALGDRVAVVVQPRAVTLHRHPPTGSARNTWPGTVVSVEPVGERVRVSVAGTPPIVAEVTALALTELGVDVGGAVWVALKATELDVQPA